MVYHRTQYSRQSCITLATGYSPPFGHSVKKFPVSQTIWGFSTMQAGRIVFIICNEHLERQLFYCLAVLQINGATVGSHYHVVYPNVFSKTTPTILATFVNRKLFKWPISSISGLALPSYRPRITSTGKAGLATRYR